MMSITTILLLFWAHWIGDFLFQTTYMSMKKSKSVKALLWHCLVYSMPFLIFGWRITLLAGILHFPVDFITSKITNYLWWDKKVKWFFTVIGLDQAIHMTILVLTYKWVYLI